MCIDDDGCDRLHSKDSLSLLSLVLYVWADDIERRRLALTAGCQKKKKIKKKKK